MRPSRFRSFEILEFRRLLAAVPLVPDFSSGLGYKNPHVAAAIAGITTTRSEVPITLHETRFENSAGPGFTGRAFNGSASAAGLDALEQSDLESSYLGIEPPGLGQLPREAEGRREFQGNEFRGKPSAGFSKSSGDMESLTSQSGGLIRLDTFRADARFAGIDGTGFSTVILDTGIDLNHPFFGPDADLDGVSDRIVFSYDFADNDSDASDVNGHGSNVSSIVASSDATHTGMAPGANVIHLKVFTNSGGGNFGYTESALQWVVANAAAYNIASVNMSLGDSQNYTQEVSLYGVSDEMAALAAMDVIVASSSGNSFFPFNSAQGVAYPSADPNSLSVGAVYDSSAGGFNYGSGAAASSSGPGVITPFSQRHSALTDVMAPGAPITGANQSGGTVTQHGTSQASPHISGIAVLAQQLATQALGRRLSMEEYRTLLRTTATTINDGDDENDNVTNTGLNFPLVDVFALGEAIWAMGDMPSAAAAADDVWLASAAQEIVVTYTDNTGIDVSDLGADDIRVTGPNGYAFNALFVEASHGTDGTPRTATYSISPPGALWTSADNGTYTIEILADAVSDIDGNTIAAGPIGGFEVVIADELGPDGFGYYASAVASEFLDIASTGALVLNGSDDSSIQLSPAGFSFDFYGTTYSSLFASSNGLITFGSGHTSFSNTNLGNSPSQAAVAVYWDDLDAPAGSGVYWQLMGSGDQQQLVLQWETSFFNDSGALSFQAILKEIDNSIRINYRDLVGGSLPGEGDSATVGIKAAGNQGPNRLIPVFNEAQSPYTRDGRSFDFHPGNRAPHGLSLDNNSLIESSTLGQVIGLFSAADNDAGDTHSFALVSGNGDTHNGKFAIVGDQLQIAEAIDFEEGSSLSIRVRVTDASGLSYEEVMSVLVIDAPELVGGPVIGDGSAQRSRLTAVTLTFEGDVQIAEGAFSLIRRGTEGGPVTTSFTKQTNGLGQTEVTLAFSGAFTRADGVLVDGYYQLTIDGTKITRNNVQLDANQDGITGDSLVIGDEEADGFFALYGDTNGDGLVGIAEFGQFRSSFGKTPDQAGYNVLFDYDGLGVGISDFGQFRNRFGKPKLPWE